MRKRISRMVVASGMAAVCASAFAAQKAYVWPDYSVHRTAYPGDLDRRAIGSSRMHSDSPNRRFVTAKADAKAGKKVAASAPALAVASAPAAAESARPAVVAQAVPRSALPELPPPQVLTAEQRWQLYTYP